jgi:hypothetical protein
MVFGSLQALAENRLGNGIAIRVWRTAAKFGECGDSETIGYEAQMCPRSVLLVSLTGDLADVTKSSLFHTDTRLGWRLAATQDATGDKTEKHRRYHYALNIDACEAPEAVDTGKANPAADDGWRWVPYRIDVADFDDVRLSRLSSNAPPEDCSP